MEFETVIGLEVHAELSTKTKIFCGCKNSFGATVNTQTCPVCLGFPGTLPTLNETVVDYAVKMGHALNCTINNRCKQDRKNYFYPDLPKAYQISQFDIPLCIGGYLDVLLDGEVKRIGVTRIHIEEDAGKLLHLEDVDGALVDYNRCGVPLIEIVSEPDMRSSAEAKAYLDAIKNILQYIDISDCKMQEGSIRCDINVSVREKGSDKLGTRTEMKNVNSFSGAVRAIEYESARQIEMIKKGITIDQETRRWDDVKGENFVMRSKENANDYRYFPEPDLPPIILTKERVESLKKTIPELPNVKAMRYMRDYSLPFADVQLLAEDQKKAQFFENCIALGGCQPKSVSNWMLGDISKLLNERSCDIDALGVAPKSLVALIKLIEKGTISNTAGKTVFEEMLISGKDPDVIVDEKGLGQVSSEDQLIEIVTTVLRGNPKAIEDYKNGKTNVLGFLVGQCMRGSGGTGNPGVLRDLLLREIEK